MELLEREREESIKPRILLEYGDAAQTAKKVSISVPNILRFVSTYIPFR